MRKGSLFFVYWVILCLLLGLFSIPETVLAESSTQVTVSAIVLEHLTYQKTDKSYIISTNRIEGITIYTKNSSFSGKIIEIPMQEIRTSKTPFIIVANF